MFQQPPVQTNAPRFAAVISGGALPRRSRQTGPNHWWHRAAAPPAARTDTRRRVRVVLVIQAGDRETPHTSSRLGWQWRRSASSRADQSRPCWYSTSLR